jgi:hypothetical protein
MMHIREIKHNILKPDGWIEKELYLSSKSFFSKCHELKNERLVVLQALERIAGAMDISPTC